MEVKYTGKHLGKNVVFFDGVCLLCDSTIRWLFEKDQQKNLHFAALQGHLAAEVLTDPKLAEDRENLNGLIFVRDLGGKNQASSKSSAVLLALDSIGGIWRLPAALRFVPPLIRDFVYDIIAKNRYKWFGKRPNESCFLPPAEDSERFIDL